MLMFNDYFIELTNFYYYVDFYYNYFFVFIYLQFIFILFIYVSLSFFTSLFLLIINWVFVYKYYY